VSQRVHALLEEFDRQRRHRHQDELDLKLVVLRLYHFIAPPLKTLASMLMLQARKSYVATAPSKLMPLTMNAHVLLLMYGTLLPLNNQRNKYK
jgi:hypothetical protein